MSSDFVETRLAPRWLHAWSVLTVGVTVAMLALGAVVTTFQVGMADPIWPTYPWHLALIDWHEPQPGFVIEHVHRLAGHVIGIFVIVLTVALWLLEPRRPLRGFGLATVLAQIISLGLCFAFLDRSSTSLTSTERWLCGLCVTICLASVGVLLTLAQREWRPSLWLRWLGTVALVAVIFQGLLGGFRVKLNALAGTNLAIIHGCFAQVVFSVLVGLAVLTAARDDGVVLSEEESPRLQRWFLLLPALVFLQLVLGALIRHTNGALAQRMHFFTAFVVVAAAVWLGRTVFASPSARRVMGRAMLVLTVLLTLQILLGVESWLGKYLGVVLPEAQKPTIGQAATRVAHVLVGSFVLASSVTLAVLAHRSVSRDTERNAERAPLPVAAKPQVGLCNIVSHLEGSA
jgi:cytochrome c oxidase assembly protein subunit 15